MIIFESGPEHDDQRQQRDQRRRVDAGQKRIKSPADTFVPAHGNAEDHTDNHGNDKADGKVREAEPHVLPDRAVREKLEAFSDNLAERWKVEGIDNLGASGDFPSAKKD